MSHEMISAALNNTLRKNGSTYISNNRAVQRGTRPACGEKRAPEKRWEYRGQAVIFVWDSQVFYEHRPLNAHEQGSLEICVFFFFRSIFPGSSPPPDPVLINTLDYNYFSRRFSSMRHELWDPTIACDRSTFPLCFGSCETCICYTYIKLACASAHEWVNIIKSKQMIKELSNKKIHWVMESIGEKVDKSFREGGEKERRFFSTFLHIFRFASLFEINLSSIPCSIFDWDNFLCKNITLRALLARVFALKILSEATDEGEPHQRRFR